MKKFLLLTSTVLSLGANAQTIGTFVGVEPKPQTQLFDFPSTHTFQLIAKKDDPLTEGGTMPTMSDFTGFVPKTPGSSTDGYLCVNSEFVPGGVSVFNINFNTATKRWETTASGKVDFSEFNCALLSAATTANCSGGITPWGTMVTSEENNITIPFCTYDGYESFGWNIEIDPATRQVIDQDGNGNPDKIWAMGRMKHENVCFAADQKTAYYGDDNSSTGYIFKFVADVATKLGSGSLYVLKLDATPTSGTWVQINNTTTAERNTTLDLAEAAGGTKFDRIEDVEVDANGMVYAVSTGQSRIYRFQDNGTAVSNFEIFVDNINYTVVQTNGTTEVTFSSPDNLAFDSEGNLWVTQDGGDNHLWVVHADHTPASPHISVFGNTPAGCESTGINFTPDGKFLFLSFQHPTNTNTQSQKDVNGLDVVHDKETTIVISRKEEFGPAGIEDIYAESTKRLNVFPNPTDGNSLDLNFDAKATGTATMSIYDIQGRELQSEMMEVNQGSNNLWMDLSNINRGIFFVLLEQDGFRYTARFVKAD